MKIEGTHKITAPVAMVWRKLMDPTVLRRALPGCERLEETGQNRYRAVLKVGVGPVRGTFNGDVMLSEIVPEHSYALTSHATSSVGFVDGVGRVQMENFAGETIVRFTGEVKIGGTLASVGGRLIEAAAQKNMRETFDNLARECARIAPAIDHPAGP